MYFKTAAVKCLSINISVHSLTCFPRNYFSFVTMTTWGKVLRALGHWCVKWFMSIVITYINNVLCFGKGIKKFNKRKHLVTYNTLYNEIRKICFFIISLRSYQMNFSLYKRPNLKKNWKIRGPRLFVWQLLFRKETAVKSV